MILIQRPGLQPLEIETLLIDFEGTLALDRRVHPKAKDKINLLSKRVKVCILAKGEDRATGDVLRKVNAEVFYFPEGEASQRKLALLHQRGPSKTAAIGNGADDGSMLEQACLGLCVLGREGTAAEAMKRADLIFSNITEALDFLLKPLRQKATLGI